ncbi:MAG: hypothetical protein Q8K12_04495 [Thiobacillus sp.]|nr:hypothetical protein [Thiobacillus sp.]
MIDFVQTKIRCRSGILLLVALLSGCGELAYKRGANSSDLEAAKKSCLEKEPDTAAVEKCMAHRGWVVHNLSRMEPLDADPVVEASVIPSDRRIENAASATPGATQPTAAKKRTPEITDTFKVSSWWKTGSGAANLKSDTEACVAKLGDAHLPDSQTLSATRGLLLCMKDKGWSGLRAK